MYEGSFYDCRYVYWRMILDGKEGRQERDNGTSQG